MTDEIWNAIVSGGSVSILLGGIVYWQNKIMNKRETYWHEEVTRVRGVGEKIIAQKDELLMQKDQAILDMSKQSEEKLLQAMKDTDTRIGSIVKMYEEKIKIKDDQINETSKDMQGVLIEDATLRARQIDSIINLTNAIKEEYGKK